LQIGSTEIYTSSIVAINPVYGANLIWLGSNSLLTNISSVRYGPNQGFNIGSVSIGSNTGGGVNSIGMGVSAGAAGSGAIAMGGNAACKGQVINPIAFGWNAGTTTQRSNAIAIGSSAGSNVQGSGSIAIGSGAGITSQGSNSIAIGASAGNNSQSINAIAIGGSAGGVVQRFGTIAIGFNAGASNQNSNAIAIGMQAGFNAQSNNAIAIGMQAGCNAQGSNAIAIGWNAVLSNQASNSIVINAGGTALNASNANAFYVAPIRAASNANILMYNTTNREVTHFAKTFVIDHPTKSDKYLVHACLEGPEAGVYYRGTIFVDNPTIVELPEYTSAFSDFTVTATPVHDGQGPIPRVQVSEVQNGRFILQANAPTEVYWVAYGKRAAINVEPEKATTTVAGQGPYKWIA
jgi:hypothetical protein